MADTSSDTRYRAPALEKGLDIIELLAASGTPLSVTQISVGLNRSVGELFRVAQVLESRDYIAQSKDGTGLVLSEKLFTLGMTRGPIRNLLATALPTMLALSEAVNQSCHLGLISMQDMVVVARVEAPGDLGFSVRVGYRRPITGCTSGVVLYAFQDVSGRAKWNDALQCGLKRETWSAFVSCADVAREHGHHSNKSGRVAGVTDLSVPVIGAEGVAVAALTIPHVVTDESLSLLDTLERLKLAAGEIGFMLGAQGATNGKARSAA